MGDYLLGVSDYLIFILLGLVIPLLSLLSQDKGMPEGSWSPTDKRQFFYYNAAFLSIGTLVVVALWFWHDRAFSTLGFALPVWNDVVMLSLGVFIVLFVIEGYRTYIYPTGREKTRKNWQSSLSFLPVNFQEFRPFTVMALSAAINEEIVYRAFFINFILAFSGQHWIGQVSSIVLPAVIFGLMHNYQGHGGVIKAMTSAILFGIIFYYSKSLLWVVVLHFIVDMIGGYAAMSLLRHTQVETTSPPQKDE